MFWYAMLALLAGMAAIIFAMTRPAAERSGGSIDLFFSDDTGPREDIQEADPYAVNYDQPGKRVLVAFGTEYGFSEAIAKKVVDRIRALDPGLGYQPRLVNLRDADAIDWSREELALFIVSTTGDGVVPADTRGFFDWLSGVAAPGVWKHLRFSTLALGDSSYTHYCRAGITLHQRALDLGATAIAPRVSVDQEDWPVIDGWIDCVTAALPDVPLSVSDEYLDVAGLRSAATGPSRTNPFLAQMDVRRELTQAHAEEEPRRVIHAELNLAGSGLAYMAGDAVGIYPTNNPPEVERLLSAMRCRGDETAALPAAFTFYRSRFDKPPTLREVLTLAYDLKTIRPELLQHLATKATDASDVQEIHRLLANGLSPSGNRALANYIYGHEVADVLLQFGSSRPSMDAVLERMRVLQPRYYSISSTPTEAPNRCAVTVAVVRYNLLGLPRTGVCTTYLAERMVVGDRVPVFISRNAHFRLPANGATPMIMIGPGTGIAPFRAFLRERCAAAATGPNVLYFGCRRRDTDFLYREELEEMERQGTVRLRVAFSREQAEKVYVQHLLRQDARDVWALLEAGAHTYVCGDAQHMAGDVHRALLDIIKEQGGVDERGAEAYMQRLEQSNRYQRDVWL